MKVKVNEGTLWEYEIDDTLRVGDYVMLPRKWNGKRRGVWQIEKMENVVTTKENHRNFSKTVWQPGGPHGKYVKNVPPIGMSMHVEVTLRRVMNIDFNKPSRRDTTYAYIEQVERVTDDFVRELEKNYASRIDRLDSLLAGSW